MHSTSYRQFLLLTTLSAICLMCGCGADAAVADPDVGGYRNLDREHGLSAVLWQGPGMRAVNPVRIASTSAATFHMGLPMDTGDSIKEVVFRVSGNGADVAQYDVLKTTAKGLDASLASGAVPGPGEVWQDIIVGVPDTTLATGESVSLIVVVNAAGIALGNVSVIRGPIAAGAVTAVP